MQLQLDERPDHNSLWSFSQCLLAEAETLSLLQTTPISTTSSSPLKLKQMQGDQRPPLQTASPDQRARTGATVDKPCKYFLSDAGCKAGRSCRWQHSWEGVEDKASRCLICGGKDHRKNECKLKAGKRQGEPAGGSGGGRGAGAGSPATSSNATGGKAGAAAVKIAKAADDVAATTTTTNADVTMVTSPPEVTSSTTSGEKDGAHSGGSDNSKGEKTAELLHEATQLLKTLRIPSTPKLAVMQIGGLDQADANMVLIDSGATHGLRPARDQEEWDRGVRTVVQLANGSTEAFKLKPNTKILMSNPTSNAAWIVPMGGVTELGFTMSWSGNQCQLRDDQNRNIDVQVLQGCPMVSLTDGQRLLDWLEHYQVYQQRKLAMVRSMLADETLVDRNQLNLELALTYKLRQHFPNLPDELMMRIVPHLELVRSENFEAFLPWNRRKRRRLRRAKHVVIHVFSGPDQTFWERQCSTATTEVICVDTACSTSANLHDRAVYGYLLALCASGRVSAIMGGPPCRTVSALRYQHDQGPGVLRTDAYPYGLPTLSPADTELVMADSILMFRFWSLMIMAEEVRSEAAPPTQFFMEQPEDPANYRSQADVQEHGYFSVFRTQEWREFAATYNLIQYHFDQHPMGHPKRKPTCLASNVTEMQQLDGIRGAPTNEAELTEQFRAMPVERRCEVSRTWSTWAPGLKRAIAMSVSQRIQWLDRVPDEVQQPAIRTLSSAALEAWKEHYLNDHMPSRRDCQHCVRAQARARPHRRVQHPEAFTLSVDLSGKLTSGINQEQKACKYLLVGVYTFPVTKRGAPLVTVDGMELQDHPLPDPGELSGEEMPLDEDEHPLPDLLQEELDEPLDAEAEGDDGGRFAESTASGCLDAWRRLVEESKDVAVKNLTFVETLEGRTAQHVLPAIANIYSRLRQLGLPVMRLHSDRAREFTASSLRRWAQNRDIVLTKTAGDDYKANGRCEAEIGVVKRAVRTILSAGGHNVTWWPLVARHVGERRLRAQLRACGYPVGDLLRFGTKAFTLRKWWQHSYGEWRDLRQPVIVLGPDACSTLTTTHYFVQAVETGRYFFTTDVITPDFAATEEAVLGLPREPPDPAVADRHPVLDDAVYLPERDDVSRPAGMDLQPSRRLRSKTSPAMLHRLSRAPIEGENENAFPSASSRADHYERLERVDTPSGDRESDENSWTLETFPSREPSTGSSSGGGEEEGAPNSRAGGSYPTASRESFLCQMQHNLHQLVMEEMSKIDGSEKEQAWCMPILSELLVRKAAVEDELCDINDEKEQVKNQKLANEFLVTKTVANKEVWENLQDWEPSVRAEFEQLVNQKQAVRQMSRAQLQALAQQRQLPIELLPGKMVHTRKASSGAYRSRAVVCGNYQSSNDEDRYAGGADGCQIRAMIRTAALKQWEIGGSDIRVAFLNAPKRDVTKLTAMEVPSIFKRLGLAGQDDVWLIERALYGLTSSPRDWGVHRDEVLPTLRWTRQVGKAAFKGSFIHSKDENLWRLIEVDQSSGEQRWVGLMSVYVDDILIAAEPETVKLAMNAIKNTWAISDVELASQQTIRYCGFEILADSRGDGFHVGQRMYEQELMTRWSIKESLPFPAFKISESDENVEVINPEDVRNAQMLTGALLWVSTRTRPDIAFGVSAMSRLTMRNPVKAVEIGYTLLKYLRGNPGGMHFSQTIPGGDWGHRGHLKAMRHPKMLEVFSDISYGANADHRSIQGMIVCYGGVPIAWQCGAQPFVAHSTAEAELIAYCESLVVGKATEALLCAIWGEDINQNTFDRVIYGDNAAAIGLAHGVTTSSWRTRHLRIRASVLKEALSDSTINPGGRWKLIHLKGTELMADGCTKPLQGQAFAKFVEDLGLKRGCLETTPTTNLTTDGGGNHGAAVRALVVGSLLLSTAEGHVESEDDGDLTLIWVTGAILMMMGAVYVGQLLHSATRCCLKRLWKSEGGDGFRPHRREDSESSSDETVLVVSEDERSGASARGQTGRRTTSKNRTSRSGCSECGAGSSSNPIPSRSGFSTGKHGATRRTKSSSLTMSSRSGLSYESASGVGASTLSPSTPRVEELATSSRMLPRSGPSSGDSIARTGDAEGSDGASITQPRRQGIPNVWNLFQHENKGKGLTSRMLSQLYQDRKLAHST